MTAAGKWQREAQSMAMKVRAEAGMGQGPIGDVFALLERLDILYLRYPAGETAVEGFAARRAGSRIIFCNSSYPRGKEHFTAAHELGHLYLDLPGDDLLVDGRIESDPPAAVEARANHFAAHFLMPADAVVSYVSDRIGVEPGGMTAKHVVAVQQFFKVSYAAALIRLKALGLIDEAACERAKGYGGCSSLAELTRRCGFGTDLGQADGGVHVPPSALRKVVELYESDRVPYGSVKYFAEMLKTSPEMLGFAPRDAGMGDDQQ